MTYIILLALALSIDTFVLAVSIGLSIKNDKSSKITFSPLKYCLIFGIVQAGLYAIGTTFSGLLASLLKVNLHISSIVFLVLAIKMLIEFFSKEEIENNLNINSIWKIAVLTSIDAFIVGLAPHISTYANYVFVIWILILTSIAAYLGVTLAYTLKKINIIEHYSLLLGSCLLLILSVVSF